MSLKFLNLFILQISVVFAFVNRNQSVEIRGKFICGSEVIHRAAVEVWKDDKSVWKSAFYILMQKRDSMDTYLARTNTNEFGEFVIAATYQQHLVIKPYLYVYHRCEIEKYSISEYRPEFKLWRTFVIKVPERYVNTGNRALRVLDLGVYNLQFQFLDEILLENCNLRSDLYYRRCAYSLPSPFFRRLTHHNLYIH